MRFSRSFNINRISKKTGCPVLTVKGTARLEAIKNIVLPVDAHLPLRKVMFASYLARHFNARIHLIALSEPGDEDNVENKVYLYKTYQLLRENTNLTVECHTVHGGNIADTTLEYARQINADLIVVNPGKEMLLSGFVNRLFARLLFNESRIPVMTVAPAR
jgi:K+-sensing histidine kinase KdpD